MLLLTTRLHSGGRCVEGDRCEAHTALGFPLNPLSFPAPSPHLMPTWRNTGFMPVWKALLNSWHLPVSGKEATKPVLGPGHVAWKSGQREAMVLPLP